MANDINMAVLRQSTNQAILTHFQHGWQFRVEIDGQPGDWDFYCKEISQQPWDIEATPFNAGATPISYPSRKNPITLSMTMRDNEDGRIWDWFDGKAKKVVNLDGTFNPPRQYLLKCKIFRRLSDGSEALRQEMKLVPLSLGEITESLDADGNVLEFPITFVEFRAGSSAY